MAIWNTLQTQLNALPRSTSANQRRASFEKLQALPKALQAQRQKVEAPGTLNAKGVAEAIREFAAKNIAANYRRERLHLDEAKRKLDDRRKALAAPPVDKTDIAAAMLRQEIRGFVRSLDDAKRTALIATTNDSSLIAALLEAPDYLTGVSEGQRSHLEQAFVETHHPDELASIEREREGLEIMGMAVDASGSEIREHLGFGGQADFDDWLRQSTPDIERNADKTVGPDVDFLVEQVRSLPDWESRARISNAITDGI